MKKTVLGILLGFVVFTILSVGTISCMGPKTPTEYVTINTQFYVTDVYVAKYSKVKGYVIYNNIKIPSSNGSSGYYYKHYSLKEGDVINVSVDISREDNGYNSTTLSTSSLDLSRYIE